METAPDEIEKVKNWPTPKNSYELRSFLAFAGYYRRFVKDFSNLIKPLKDLHQPTSRMKHSKTSKKEWNWTNVEQQTFEKFKEILTSLSVLAYPEFAKPFELHVEASTTELGAVLYQIQGDKTRVISYASRSLFKTEKNYPACKLAFLSLKSSEKVGDYLAG